MYEAVQASTVFVENDDADGSHRACLPVLPPYVPCDGPIDPINGRAHKQIQAAEESGGPHAPDTLLEAVPELAGAFASRDEATRSLHEPKWRGAFKV